jgi:hypothetical protein
MAVDQGTVCIHYGPYQIGETKLKGDNPGITICTAQPGNNVKSVFEVKLQVYSILAIQNL